MHSASRYLSASPGDQIHSTALVSHSLHSRPSLLERPWAFRRRARSLPGLRRTVRVPARRRSASTTTSCHSFFIVDAHFERASSKSCRRNPTAARSSPSRRIHFAAKFPANMLLACFSVVPSLILPQSRTLRTPAADASRRRVARRRSIASACRRRLLVAELEGLSWNFSLMSHTGISTRPHAFGEPVSVSIPG